MDGRKRPLLVSYLPPGRYQLRPRKDGYQGLAYGAKTATRPAGTIQLAAGETRADLVLRLQRTSSISGVVLGDDGEPVGYVLVAALRLGFQRQKRKLLPGPSANTDRDGRYRISGLAPGPYAVMVSSPYRVVSKFSSNASPKQPQSTQQYTFGTQYYPGTDQPESAAALELSPGQDAAEIDFRLTARPTVRLTGKLLVPPGFTTTDHVIITVMNGGLGNWNQLVVETRPPDFAFQLDNLLPGSYVVVAQASVGGKQYRGVQPIKLEPQGLEDLVVTMDPAMLTYAPQFYPGVSDPTGATRIEASSNAKLIGIDLRMSPAAGVTVKGRVGSLAAGRNLQVAFQSKDSARVDWQHYNVRLNGSTGEFQIPNVPPGSYELIAKSTSNGTTLFAQVSVEVGEKPIEPLQVALDPTATLSGTVSIEGDVKVLMSNWHVQMQPLDRRPIMPQPPDVKSDGTFTLNSVVPGRWRLIVNGAPGYLKSMTQGAQEISPFDFEVGLAGGGPLNVVIGTAFAQVDASVTGLPPATDQVACLMWPTNGDPNRTQTQGVNRSAHLSFNLPPGKYYGCAVSDGQPWALLQNRPLRKALESACQVVEITESGRNSVTLPFLSVEDLKRIRDKLEQ